MGEPLVDFAIVTAIETERKAVCVAFELTDRDRIPKESRVYWCKALELKDGEFYQIVVAQSPDMAGVDAALLVSDIIHHWHPAAILLVGIAAGVDRTQQAFGDLVIGRDVYYYERGKLTPDGKRPEPIMYRADATLLNHVQAAPDWIPASTLVRPDGTQTIPQRHYGVIASGEKVIADSAVRDEITAGHRKIIAIEMEGFGFSAGVWQSFERIRHLVIKAICDFADEQKGDNWQPYAAAVAAEFTKHFLLDRPLEPRNPPVPVTHWEGVGRRYKPIVEAFFDGTVIPFLGSGVNLCDRVPILKGALNTDPPSEIELAAGLIEEIRRIDHIGQSGIMELIGVPCLFCHLDLKDRPDECPIRKKIMAGETGDRSNEIWKCPLAIEQSLAVAKTNLRFLSQHYKTEKNPKSLYDFVQESFKSAQPNRLHRFLADLPHKMTSLPYQLIVTTNYDNLLESAFCAFKQPFDVLFYVAGDADAGGGIFHHKRYGEAEAKPIRRANKYSDLPLDSTGSALTYPVILKLYGSLDDRNFVITEDHHIDYLLNSDIENKIPSKILKILKESSILFLGYSLNDYDLQLILHQSWAKQLFDSKSSWFVHKSRPGSLEAKLWEKRGVTLIDSTLEECLTHLETGIDLQLREAGKHA